MKWFAFFLFFFFCPFLTAEVFYEKTHLFCTLIVGHKPNNLLLIACKVPQAKLRISPKGEPHCLEYVSSPSECTLITDLFLSHSDHMLIVQCSAFSFPTNGLRWAYVTVARQMGEWACAHAGGFIHYSEAVQCVAERGLPSLSIIQLSHYMPPPFLAVFPFFLFVCFFLLFPVNEVCPLMHSVQKQSISTPDIQKTKGASERRVTVRQWWRENKEDFEHRLEDHWTVCPFQLAWDCCTFWG